MEKVQLQAVTEEKNLDTGGVDVSQQFHDCCQHYRNLLLQLLSLLLHLLHFPHLSDLGVAPPRGAALILGKQIKGKRCEVERQNMTARLCKCRHL